jgi:thiol-disulfide isomerase/thioredoxin
MSLRLNTPLPDLSGATEWLNGRPDSTRLAGRAALVYFWSVSCHLCHENMPVIAEWRERYAPHGVQFIAIHVPRQAADMDVERVRALACELKVVDPCGVDNQHAVKRSFGSQYVPAYFFFDAGGRLRGRAAGATGLALLEQTLQRQSILGS